MARNISNEELADMYKIYGEARGNAREAARLYQEMYPNRYLPNHRMFTAIHQRLRENGRFGVDRGAYGRPRRFLKLLRVTCCNTSVIGLVQVPELQHVT